jgi:hypothetical protein
MTDPKRYKTEWTFSFEKLGSDIGDFVKSLGMSGDEVIKQAEYSTPIAGATSAHVRLDFSVGETIIRPLTNLDNLIEADVTYVGDVDFVVAGDQEKTVTLSQRAAPADWVRGIVGWIGSQGKLRWDVGLSGEIPMYLELHGGVGTSRFDLSDLQLTGGRIFSGTGEIDLKLPMSSTSYQLEVNCGVGEMEIVVPPGANVDLKLRCGTGKVELEIGEGANVTAHIEGGVGECKVELPPAMEARFEADSGVGALNFPARFQRTLGKDEFISKSGVWETPGFASATSKVAIRYKGGVGALNVE